MPERTVSVSIVADMSNYLAGMSRAGSATTGLGKTAQTTGDLTRGVFSKLGGSLSSFGNQVGGTVGVVLSQVGSDIDKIASKSAHLSTALEVGGGAAVAAGLGLQQLGSGSVQATDQLNAAIGATGESVSDYQSKIDAAVSSGENFNHTEEDTKAALTALIPAAGSTQKALDFMQVTTDLAAAKHESLATAATAVARVLGGNGSRTLAVYGIHMDGIGTKTQQGTKALAELDDKLNGQATASVQNFGAQVGVVTTKVGDFIKNAAGPAGQILTGFGVAATGAGVVLDIYRSHQVAVKAAQDALNASTAAAVAPLEGDAAATVAAGDAAETATPQIAGLAAAEDGAATSGAAASGGLAAIGAAAGPVAVGVAGLAAELVGIKAASGGIEDLLGQTKTLAQYTAAADVSAGSLAKTLGGSAQWGSSFKDFVSQTGNFSFDTARNISNTPVLGAITPTPAVVGEANKADMALAALSGKQLATVYQGLATQAQAAGAGAGYMADTFPKATAALAAQSDAAGTDGDKTTVLAASFNAAALKAADLKSTTGELEKSLAAYGGTAQTAESATEGYYSALDAANKSVKDNGKSIDDSTVKGRANNQTLYALAQSADALAAANLKAKVPIDQVKASLDQQRQSFITVAENMGYTTAAATALATKLIGVTTTKYNFTLDGVTVATNSLATYLNELNKIPGKVTTSVQLTPGGRAVIHTGGYVDKNGVGHFASGGGYGLYQGPGSGTSDSIPAMVSNGEYINSAATVSRLGVDFFQSINRGGAPAPTYMHAPQASVVNHNIYVSVPVSQSLIGNEDFLAKTVVTSVQKGLKSGVVPANWNVQ